MHSAAPRERRASKTSSSNHDAWRNSNARASARQHREEVLEARQVLLEIRRELEERRAGARAEGGGDPVEPVDLLGRRPSGACGA
jgi:hypothetical protein